MILFLYCSGCATPAATDTNRQCTNITHVVTGDTRPLLCPLNICILLCPLNICILFSPFSAPLIYVILLFGYSAVTPHFFYYPDFSLYPLHTLVSPAISLYSRPTLAPLYSGPTLAHPPSSHSCPSLLSSHSCPSTLVPLLQLSTLVPLLSL